MMEGTPRLAGLWIGDLTQKKSVLPLSNEHGSQVKDQGRRQCCHNKHKKFSYGPTRDGSLLSGLLDCLCVLLTVLFLIT